jgi:hypothetical protein
MMAAILMRLVAINDATPQSIDQTLPQPMLKRNL